MHSTSPQKLFDFITQAIGQEKLSEFTFSSSDKDIYSKLLNFFVHYEFEEEDAIHHWENIVYNKVLFEERLNKEVSIYVAIADYFTSSNSFFASPVIVESETFHQSKQYAMIDPLTGLFNRRYMDIALKKEINRCDRYRTKVSIVMINIDNFKQLNDTYGHLFGDQVLSELGNIIKESIRGEDIACRFGGEEFLLILPETNALGAFILAERIRDKSLSNNLFQSNHITFSAGTATSSEIETEATCLIQCADEALYEAKKQGKNRTIQASNERRKYNRFPHSWDVELLLNDYSKSVSKVVTNNISTAGVQFATQMQFLVDTQIEIIFRDPNILDNSITASGKITWIKKTADGFLYGAIFDENNDQLNLLLKQGA